MTRQYLNDHKGAIADFTKVIIIDPKMLGFDAYYYRGVSKIKLNNKNGACLDFKKGGDPLGKADEMIKKYCK